MERGDIKEQNKIYSYVVCFLLNNLGYNEDIRRFRESLYVKQTHMMSNLSLPYDNSRVIATGSKVEGACLPLQCDIDLMHIFENIMCAEGISEIRNLNTLKPVYSDKIPPGYVRVAKGLLDDTTWMGIVCSESYLHLTPDGQPYISSTFFHNFCKQECANFHMTLYDLVGDDQFSFSGPACTKTMQLSLFPDGDIRLDIVKGIYFCSPLYLPRWAARQRHYCWPSPDVIYEISSMEGYIVPVGSIGGENPNLDWRISYVTAENKLISNLNDVQFKLYIILKMIAKELIYPDFPVISSYVVKNIVLWVCELNPQSLFTADLLFDPVRKCFSFMRTCLQNNHLPNYIIPERNLIALRINVHSKRQLIFRVHRLLDDGLSIFSKLSIFKKHSPLALVLAPRSVYFFGKRRDHVEKYTLIQGLLRFQLCNFDDFTRSSVLADKLFNIIQDDRYLFIEFQVLDILFPDVYAMFVSGDLSWRQFADVWFSRLKFYLS